MKHHETICIKVYAYVCVTHTHIYIDTHMCINKMIMIRLFATITAAADAPIV